jgi:hypothetical protein
MPKSNAKLAKKVLLKAIREFDLGLVQYQVLLDKVNGGESRASLQQSFVTLKSASPRRAGTSRRA